MAQLPSTYTGPGLVDLQINGYVGVDFNNDPAGWTPEMFHKVRSATARRGVAVMLPTFVTNDADLLVARAAKYAEIIEADTELAACFPKLHIEGPFISPIDGPRGAHPKEYCRLPHQLPDLIDRIHEACGGRVGILTLAPELVGAEDLIRRSVAKGIVVALGHTQAGADDQEMAVQAGATMSTHLGNGSHPVLPRLDNYTQRQLADDRLWAGFIADGHHIPFPTLKNFIRAKKTEKSVLVTDAILAAELEPGTYYFMGENVEVYPNGYVSVPGAANLAGSALTLDMAVINTAAHCDVTFDMAWKMASTYPADLVNVPVPADVTQA